MTLVCVRSRLPWGRGVFSGCRVGWACAGVGVFGVVSGSRCCLVVSGVCNSKKVGHPPCFERSACEKSLSQRFLDLAQQ